MERFRQREDSRHPCFDAQTVEKRLKSRKRFLNSVLLLAELPYVL